MIDDLWYKNAIIYCLDVETFMDSNGDGVGDFQGLRRRLDYLAGLGVTCLWLSPFYASPNRDNGYDVRDYYAVDPRLGDLGDFVQFAHEARNHGMRVIADLVVNHTSNEHPWFQEARQNERSKYRDYYIWSREKPKDADKGMVFPGQQTTIWSWDDQAQAYYHHRFWEHQPDLNIGNPEVQREILKIMGFWLELGVSGFRVDAVPFMIDDKNPAFSEEEGWQFLTTLRDFLSWRRGDAILLAEANVTMEEAPKFFDDGQRMQLVFNFLANQQLFLSLVDEKAEPLAAALRKAPALGDLAQWAQFLRNHDELDLGRLSDRDRERVFAALGPDKNMQLYDRGLRRRLAPMLGGDVERLELAYSLMLSLPGTPVFWYGEEIGMGENLALEDRHSVRTPMQWTGGPSAGFSRSAQLVRPPVNTGPFAPERVNVADQRRDPGSLLARIERLIRKRQECPEIGWGEARVLNPKNPHVLALHYTWQEAALVIVHNFARSPQTAKIDLKDEAADVLCDVFTGQPHRDTRPLEIELPASGFVWLRAGEGDRALSEHHGRQGLARSGKKS